MDAISYGWATITKDYVNLALPIAVGFFVANLPGQLIAFVWGIMSAAMAQSLDPSVLAALNGLVQGVSGLLNFVLGAYMAGGIVSFVLNVARGKPVEFGDVFSGGKYLGRMLVAGFCGGIAAGIGFLLCIVPGVIVALGISQYQYVVVDQGQPGIDSLKQSWEMTKGQKMNIFLFGLIAFGVIIAGVIACGIGVLLGSMPVLMHGGAYVYLTLKGERPVPR